MADQLNIWTESKCLSKKQLLGYLNQTLDREEVYLVESHLNDCALCSDALDGLMNEDQVQMPSDLKNIQEAIEKQIAAKHPVIRPEAANRQPGGKSLNPSKTSGFSVHRNRWMIAASFLFVIGLGGLLAYSYLKNHQTQLAQQTPAATQDADYNKPSDRESNEISQIQIDPNEIQPPSATTNKNTEDPIKAVPPARKIIPVVTGTSRDEAEEPYSPPTSPVNAEDIATEKPASTDNQLSGKNNNAEPATTLSKDYDKVREEPAALKEAVVSKKSKVGMSNTKTTPLNQNSKQLSYPSNNNTYNDYGNRNESVVESKQLNDTETASTVSINPFEEGMRNYQAGEYKKSISYFETALKTATGTQREDIQFHLAQAYLKTGKIRKAEKLLDALSKGSKYSAESMELLQKAKK